MATFVTCATLHGGFRCNPLHSFCRFLALYYNSCLFSCTFVNIFGGVKEKEPRYNNDRAAHE